MAQYDLRIEVRLQGQQELVFSVVSLAYQFREGDIFSYAAEGEATVEYKVESAKLELSTRDTEPEDSSIWVLPVLKVGVSVVAP